MPTLNLGREPVAIITAFIVALGALNTQIAGLTPTIHNVISAVLVILGAVIARVAVTPVAPAAPTVYGSTPTLTLGPDSGTDWKLHTFPSPEVAPVDSEGWPT